MAVPRWGDGWGRTTDGAWRRIIAAAGERSRIGPVRLVRSKRASDPWKNTRAVLTNATGQKGREVLVEYEQR